jgi:hypothetical protein
MEISTEEKAVLLWTERNRKNEVQQKRENRTAARAFLLAVIVIAVNIALATYLAGLRLRGVI